MAFRFGVNAGANAPFDALARRWRVIEELGFENLWVPDHTATFAGGGAGWVYDGWTVLTAVACHTTSIRLGSMVSNPVLRHPSMLAKQALAVDALSGGRLELGIGTGIAEFDHNAVGERYWPVAERLARFAEYVDLVAAILESPEPVEWAGEYYAAKTLRSPEPVQRPLPITIGGQARKVLDVVARHADRWNTHGPAGASVDEIVERSKQQTELLEQLLGKQGRDPAALVRSLMGVQALDVWSQSISVPEIVERFGPLGFTEFVIGWPGDDRIDDLERLAQDVLPALRS